MSHKTISDSSYVHPDVLVDTEWLEDHLQDQKLGSRSRLRCFC